MMGKWLCKNKYSRFSPGKIGYIVILPGGNQLYRQFFGGKFCYGKIIVVFFSGGKQLWGKATLLLLPRYRLWVYELPRLCYDVL